MRLLHTYKKIITQAFELELIFESIGNANSLVGNASNVANWNTYFNLPTLGNPFTSVTVVGNVITLIGGSNITLKYYSLTPEYYWQATVISVIDTGCVIGLEGSVFDFNSIITTIELPSLVTAGNNSLDNCDSITSFSFLNLTTIGTQCFAGNNAATFYLPELLNAPSGSFHDCANVTDFNLPKVLTIGDTCFRYCYGATSFYLPSCTNLGSTTGYNNVFEGISGQTITLTVPAALMTCNGGAPDGDIAYLQANNTVTIVEIG